MNQEKGMIDMDQLKKGRQYSSPTVVRYGNVANLTASGSVNQSESAGAGSAMCPSAANAFNINCPPGGF